MSKMKNMLLARTAPMIGHMPAYANSLTALLPSIYTAMDVVSRELVGFVPGVTRNASAERAAVGQTVSYPIAPAQQAYDIVPAMNVPEPPDNTFVTGTMAITKSRAVPWGFTGEEQRVTFAESLFPGDYTDWESGERVTLREGEAITLPAWGWKVFIAAR